MASASNGLLTKRRFFSPASPDATTCRSPGDGLPQRQEAKQMVMGAAVEARSIGKVENFDSLAARNHRLSAHHPVRLSIRRSPGALRQHIRFDSLEIPY